MGEEMMEARISASVLALTFRNLRCASGLGFFGRFSFAMCPKGDAERKVHCFPIPEIHLAGCAFYLWGAKHCLGELFLSFLSRGVAFRICGK
jgi:hypothetical protein